MGGGAVVAESVVAKAGGVVTVSCDVPVVCAGESAAACDAVCGDRETSQCCSARVAEPGEDTEQNHCPAQETVLHPAWELADGQVSSLCCGFLMG